MGALDIKTLCDSMLNPNKSPLENLVATTALYGPQCAAVSYAAQLAQLRNASDFGVGVGIRQWTWQTCNEFGFFQSTDAPPAKQPFGSASRSTTTPNFASTCSARATAVRTPPSPISTTAANRARRRSAECCTRTTISIRGSRSA